MTKTNKKQKNLANPVELQEHLSHRIGNVGEVNVYPSYNYGDILEVLDKTVKIVDVLDSGRYHCKNVNAPFDSFIIASDDLVIRTGTE